MGQGLALQVLRRAHRIFRVRDEGHRRARVIEGDDLDVEALGDGLQAEDGGRIGGGLLALLDGGQRALRSGPRAERHVEALGREVTLVEGHVERRVLALELPTEADRDFRVFGELFGTLLGIARLRRSKRREDAQPGAGGGERGLAEKRAVDGHDFLPFEI